MVVISVEYRSMCLFVVLDLPFTIWTTLASGQPKSGQFRTIKDLKSDEFYCE